jgi:serralysin
MRVFYISPTGSGSHSGSSAANAGTIYDLPKFIAAAGAGDEVRLLADQGAYKVTKQITIAAGGAAGAPVTIRGATSDGVAMAATIVGTRATAWTPGLSEGVELFRLVAGADHLTFADLATKNMGNGVFRIGADLEDLTINRVAATNVSRFIENNVSGSATTASVNGLWVEDVTVAGYSQNAIKLKYNSRNVMLKNVVGDSQKQNGGLVVSGVALDGTVHDVTMDHVTMRNNYGRGAAGDYWNGDGFVAERGTYNLTFRDTVATGNTDSGYDIKGNNVTLIRASASDNTKNFRLWGAESVTMTDSVSNHPRYFGGTGKPSHFQAASGANVTLDNFRYFDSSTVKVFDLSNGNNTVRLANMGLPSIIDIHFGNNSQIRLPNGVVMHGTSAGDTMAGSAGSDMLIGGKGNDIYTVNYAGDRPVEEGAEGTDLVKTSLSSYTLAAHVEKLSYTGTGNFSGTGNNLNNTITGGAGNDWLNGGTGNDVLTGGEGGDTYWYGLGGRQDTLYNGDSGGVDRVVFGSGIAADDLWFAQNGSDLLVTVRGTGGTDAVRIKGWYSDTGNRLGTFQLSDGQVLEATRVQQLVQAMAEFSTSSGAPTSLSGSEQQTVETVIAANWKTV